jgi:RNA polymerase sigma-32 factor
MKKKSKPLANDPKKPHVLEAEILGKEEDKLPVALEKDFDSDGLALTARDLERYEPSRGIDPLTQYVRQISRYKVLSPEQEKELTTALRDTGDIEIAKKLVLHNLKLVVKITLEYRTAWQNVMDLIQEGNIGLMKAVSKYDPEKGAKLSYYASWWIRSYVLKFILDNFRLVKIGTTNDQKKLFYNLMREKDRLISMGITPDTKALASSLGVSEKSVELMSERLDWRGGEISFDKPLLTDSSGSGSDLGDILEDKDEIGLDEQLANEQGLDILKEHLTGFVAGLKERDREIFSKRLMSEVPESLQSIADQYGVSRERIRQIEERLINNLRVYMSEFLR